MFEKYLFSKSNLNEEEGGISHSYFNPTEEEPTHFTQPYLIAAKAAAKKAAISSPSSHSTSTKTSRSNSLIVKFLSRKLGGRRSNQGHNSTENNTSATVQSPEAAAAAKKKKVKTKNRKRTRSINTCNPKADYTSSSIRQLLFPTRLNEFLFNNRISHHRNTRDETNLREMQRPANNSNEKIKIKTEMSTTSNATAHHRNDVYVEIFHQIDCECASCINVLVDEEEEDTNRNNYDRRQSGGGVESKSMKSLFSFESFTQVKSSIVSPRHGCGEIGASDDDAHTRAYDYRDSRSNTNHHDGIYVNKSSVSLIFFPEKKFLEKISGSKVILLAILLDLFALKVSHVRKKRMATRTSLPDCLSG